ncbi:MAG: heme-binding domain-containing protein [Bacteroidales bacterium]|nr:heme-binding domain-containing protein [Bacteroidales bacterium]
MKRPIGLYATIFVIIAFFGLVLPIVIDKQSQPDLRPKEHTLAIFDEGGCAACHSQFPVYPWFHAIPGLKQRIEKSAAEGTRSFDYTAAIAHIDDPAGIPLPDLLRLEKSIDDHNMPPVHYSLLQWTAPITGKEAAVVKNWLVEYRREHYPNGNAAHFADEPIFAIPDVAPLPADPAKVALGEKLYNDTRFSKDNTLSCASCHDLKEKYGVDYEQVSDGVNGAVGTVNAPTVLNAVFNFVQFWDGRAATLAEQAAGPPVNPVEMACDSFDEIIAKLVIDKEFMKEFSKVYPEVTEATLTDAIEHYERTLITPDGPFDRFLKGDAKAISNEAKEGYSIFKAQNCAGCHSGVIAGGLSYEYMGLEHDYFKHRVSAEVIDDNGHFNVTGREFDRHRFKVPGLRNVANTWPYFHDGTRNTLEEAVNDMAWYQYGVKLTEEETAKMVEFLKTL